MRFKVGDIIAVTANGVDIRTDDADARWVVTSNCHEDDRIIYADLIVSREGRSIPPGAQPRELVYNWRERAYKVDSNPMEDTRDYLDAIAGASQ